MLAEYHRTPSPHVIVDAEMWAALLETDVRPAETVPATTLAFLGFPVYIDECPCEVER